MREQEALQKALASVPAVRGRLSEDETELRAHLVLATLCNFSGILQEALKLQSEMESLELGGRSLDDLSEAELIERLRYLHPNRILEMHRPSGR